MKHSLVKIFVRDLAKLKEEIELYENESDLWVLAGNISNSGGNLCLHLIGNLNHFVGAILGKSGYIREREIEFSKKNVPKAELIKNINELIPLVENVIFSLSEEEIKSDFPIKKHNEKVSTEMMLLHLLSHFQYHLGQINYHRRLLI